MKRTAVFTIFLSALLLSIGQGPVPPAHAGQRVRLAVLVGANCDLADLSLPDLRRVFAGRGMNDNSGRALIGLNHAPRSRDRVAFDKVVLGLNPEGVSRFWIDRKIRGLSGPPRALDSVTLILRLLPRLPGGISYARSPQAPEGMRVLRVNGKRPGDPGYPLEFDE